MEIDLRQDNATLIPSIRIDVCTYICSKGSHVLRQVKGLRDCLHRNPYSRFESSIDRH